MINPLKPEHFKRCLVIVSLFNDETFHFSSFRLRSSHGMSLKKKFHLALFYKFGMRMRFLPMILLVGVDIIDLSYNDVTR